MANTNVLPTQIKATNLYTYSDVYVSGQRAAYMIGRPDGPPTKQYNVSENEAKEIMRNLPPELLEVVKEHYNLVDAEVIEKELEDGLMGANQYEEATGRELASEETENPTKEKAIDLDELTRDELRDIAKKLEIKGYSGMNKDELKEAIEKEAEKG